MGDSSEELKTHVGIKQGALSRLFSSLKFLVEPDPPVEDRRAGGRVECLLSTSLVTETGDNHDCTVLDVSRRGLRVRTDRSVGRGLSVAIKPPESFAEKYASLMARVMWSRKDDDGKYLTGLLLPPGNENEESWLEGYLLSKGHSASGPQRRKFLRADAELQGRLILKDDTMVPVTLLNLGLGGALIRCEPELEKMSPFKLRLGPHGSLPELELSGTILRLTTGTDAFHLHSSRFGPLDARRHDLLKKYIISLLRKSRADSRMRKNQKGTDSQPDPEQGTAGPSE